MQTYVTRSPQTDTSCCAIPQRVLSITAFGGRWPCFHLLVHHSVRDWREVRAGRFARASTLWSRWAGKFVRSSTCWPGWCDATRGSLCRGSSTWRGRSNSLLNTASLVFDFLGTGRHSRTLHSHTQLVVVHWWFSILITTTDRWRLDLDLHFWRNYPIWRRFIHCLKLPITGAFSVFIQPGTCDQDVIIYIYETKFSAMNYIHTRSSTERLDDCSSHITSDSCFDENVNSTEQYRTVQKTK